MLLDYKRLTLLTLLFSASLWADKVHDPTLPKIKVVVTQASKPIVEELSADIKLQGVVNSNGSRLAIISGELYAIGDSIKGFKISKINNDNVVLLGSGSQKRLYVYENQ